MAPGRNNYNRFEINGSKGSVAFNLERMNELELSFFSFAIQRVQGFHTIMVTDWGLLLICRHWWPPGHIIGYEDAFTRTVFDLMEAIEDQGAA